MVLTRLELWLLRTVDDRPGAGVEQLAAVSCCDRDAVQATLGTLEHDGLVRRTVIARTGSSSWRITRAGINQLIATPPPRRTPQRQAFGQLSLIHGLATR